MGDEKNDDEGAQEHKGPEPDEGGAPHSRLHERTMRREPDSAATFRSTAQRGPPSKVPEVHIMGEIVGGLDSCDGVWCRWRIEHGKHWSVLEGDPNGHSQTAYIRHETEPAAWNHPIDLHYRTTSIQGWPKIIVQIQQLDNFGRLRIVGYGFAHLPCTPGLHNISIPCWRPTGTPNEELTAHFLGNMPQLLDGGCGFWV